MPNFKGGKGFKKKKKQSSTFREKELILKDVKEDQEYGQIKKVNGSGRYQVFCFDGQERLGISAGNTNSVTYTKHLIIRKKRGIFRILY